MRRLDLDFALFPKQLAALQSEATEILFGGAAGPGKSHLLRVAGIVWCLAIPGLQCFLFRRTRPDLWKNHMEGPNSFPAMLAPLLDAGFAKIHIQDGRIEIGKSRIHLCHCEYEQDVYKYQGAEIHVLLPDELTHFTQMQYTYLRSRVRMIGLEVPAQYVGRFPRIVGATNPGNIGHNWVKSSFVDPKPAMTIWQTEPKDGGMKRQFIPALLTDNPALLRDDPKYLDRLSGMGTDELVRAMREGDWDINAGGALDDVWKRPDGTNPHVLAPFEIPMGWRIDRSFDWGSSKPFSVGWWAESNGEELEIERGVKRAFPKGSLIQIAELYGWNGEANKGCRKLAVEVAREILQVEQAMGIKGRVQKGPADSAIFDMENGMSIADDMGRIGVSWVPAEKGPGSRKIGLERVRNMLKASLVWPMESPGLFFFDTCRHSIRTLPGLPRDSRKPDDVDTEAEDHCYDQVRYRCAAAARDTSYSPLTL